MKTSKESKKATLISPTRAFSWGLVLRRNGIVHHRTVHIFRCQVMMLKLLLRKQRKVSESRRSQCLPTICVFDSDRAVMARNTEHGPASNERNCQLGDPLE